MAAPFKFTAEQLKKKFESYLIYMQTQYFLKPDMIRSGERAGEQINLKINKPLTIISFCHYVGIDCQTYYNHVNGEYKDVQPELFDVFTHIHEAIKDEQITGAALNIYNERIVSKLNGLSETINVQVTEQPVVNINLNALTGSTNKQLNENNIEDIEFTELEPIELSQNNTLLADINTSELQTNANE